MINFLLLMLFMASSQTFLPLTFAKPTGPETDRLSLLTLKEKLTNGNPQLLPSWNSSLHFCKWEGVSCSALHTRVSKLHLTDPSLDGSLAPAIEYGEGGPVTAKGDIYSYGVLLLELLTGKKPTDSMFGEHLSLHKFCKMALSERSVIEIVDSSCMLIPRGNMKGIEKPKGKLEMQESLISFANIGVACSVDLPNKRMSIKDVLVELLAIKKRLSSVGIEHIYA
ncbi:hypothetical protein QN277_015782 [Acacia crassicarpa]|uniref:Leucine-rich repeat-containing N-terminal plant-type domain-containing protein n=1 Tax=Acacia crassicarpa TaxID=499986 RepID=A0AAE1KMF6_9FABA|nr:hypothetical protein QN277_015782 [Acacia crassicarpa]